MVARAHERDPAMLFFGRDFYEDEAVKLMSFEQEAIYMRLLWHAWREGSIPSNTEAIASLLRMPARRFEKLWPIIATKWKPKPDDPTRLVNKRQESERERRRETQNRQAEAGRKGAASRWGGHESANGSAIDPPMGEPMRPQCDSMASQSQSQSQVPPSPAGPEVQEPSSFCGPRGRQDDRSAGPGPAGPSGTGGEAEVFAALRLTSYRRNSAHRDHDLAVAAARLHAAGIAPEDLVTLAKKAAVRGKKPAGLFAHWVDRVDEALKELGKR